MCPPTYYEIKYIINDWMVEDSQINTDLAVEQWTSLYDAYLKLGVDVSLIDAVEGIPELTFAGDSVFLYGDQAISSKFRHAERQPEVAPMAQWFSDLGFNVHTLPSGLHFEGNAEAVLWNDKLIGGYGIRSDAEVYPFISSLFDLEVVPLRLTNPFYHLDTCFCPLNAETIAFVPEAFDNPTREYIANMAKNVIPIARQEAEFMACNSKSVGETVIVSTRQSPQFAAKLRQLGLEVVELELSEFRKAGAGAKCLTLEAYQPV